MFIYSKGRELWIGMGLNPECPEIALAWGKIANDGESKHRGTIDFDLFIDAELGQYERGGEGSGGNYDETAIEMFENMIGILKDACDRVRRRNGEIEQ